MVKTIRVTGKDFDLPEEARGLDEPYYALACALVGYDNYPELKRLYQGNLDLAERLLERGPQGTHSGFAYSAGLLADSSDEPIELILGEERPESMGRKLEEGKIIVRGNLGMETGRSMSGGYLFVDGDVSSVKGMHGGVIYVSGHVGTLDSLYHGVLIVAGEIKNVRKGEAPNSGTPVKPSHFVFARRPL